MEDEQIDRATDTSPRFALDASARMSLRDHVRNQLRMAIISGRFAPEEKLNERAIAEEFGVSTTPLKEAVRQLEVEGLIEILPRRGMVVRFDADYAEEMILARAALESPLAALAAQRADEASRGRMQDIVNRMRDATDRTDIAALIGLNETFHGEIHAAARSRHLARLAAMQQFYDDSARRVIHRNLEESRRAFEEHSGICGAIAAGDADRAAELMGRHVTRSGRLYLAAVFSSKQE
ncbi:GntR family transcriptional regulator [Wenxinia saemankumensis]|uniref:Transcriptional regulator, GntR family n=1 Tax=Wenxinia saemankumensis TaxID=1447782 RepID=A0A1M6B5F2_9RHOB|nr:GntR family transcriptional regulator [Wenxinia saemankumensis]SHI43693.1 transcriptional regulator, GntR family [Wenxinia saemankumensis]